MVLSNFLCVFLSSYLTFFMEPPLVLISTHWHVEHFIHITTYPLFLVYYFAWRRDWSISHFVVISWHHKNVNFIYFHCTHITFLDWNLCQLHLLQINQYPDLPVAGSIWYAIYWFICYMFFNLINFKVHTDDLFKQAKYWYMMVFFIWYAQINITDISSVIVWLKKIYS